MSNLHQEMPVIVGLLARFVDLSVLDFYPYPYLIGSTNNPYRSRNLTNKCRSKGIYTPVTQ